MSDAVNTVDVAIMGGGLAGLTLAIQLRRRFPDLDVLVIERERHPVRAAAHKVGESSVEIGAHYFSEVLGLTEHLDTGQLKKFGFRFFFSEGRSDIDAVAELGASRYLATPSFQLDRGLFENYLAGHVQALGAQFVDGASVRDFTLASGSDLHEVTFVRDGVERKTKARWVIDAAGRASLIKRKLGLAEDNEHFANAVWFRMEGRIDVHDWSSDSAWLSRCDPPDRWLSTNHLCGEGYWAWLIPLASGAHSVGIVADAKLHPLRTMNTFDRALEWLGVHQPKLAAVLEARRSGLLDFAFFRNFSYGCKQVFSGDRWALTGEAGVFLDPFYSPGSDFIAIANTYITELIAKDLARAPIDGYARFYEQIFFSFYRNTLSLYTRQYGLFGDPEVMPVKVIWDYTYYWGVLCQFFFQNRLTDLRAMGRLRAELNECSALNGAVQEFFRTWSAVSKKRNPAVLFDQAELPWFAELNRALRTQLPDDAAFDATIRRYTALLRQLAAEILARAVAEHPEVDTSALRSLLDGRTERTPADAPPLLFAA